MGRRIMTASKPAAASKMTVPFYGHARQYRNIKSEIDEAFHAVIESESYVMGPTLEIFENELAHYFGMKHDDGVNSVTDALWIQLMAVRSSPGVEVIPTAKPFFATAETHLSA